MVKAYARAVFGPVGIDIGRNHVSLGHGSEGGPLLSQNARGLDMIRVSAEHPVRLPGFLSPLGLWQASALLADMGRNRDIPGSKLVVFRVSSRASRFVELGITSLNHHGGDGAPSATLRDRIADIFFFLWASPGAIQISDKVVGVDLRIRLPAIRPGFVGARVRLGVVYQRSGDVEGAIREWTRCAADDPKDMRPRAYLASVGVTLPHVHQDSDDEATTEDVAIDIEDAAEADGLEDAYDVEDTDGPK